MKYILKGAKVFLDEEFKFRDIMIENGKIKAICRDIRAEGGEVVFDFKNKYIFPGLVDVHVHLREPGFLYKETIATASAAAARGGYTTICAMPNLDPVPDSFQNLKPELDAIKKDAIIDVIPYGAITVGEKGEVLSDMESMAEYVCGFTDDGRGVQDEEMMRSAMKKAKKLNMIIAAHCEVDSLLNGGYIHAGEYARLHNHRGISSESEYLQVIRDLALAKETKVKYHICHISTRQSAEALKKAKAEGVDASGETAPHYLLLNDMNIKEEGRFKMNPPLRSEEDRQALIKAISEGTIEIIATDHAPHSKDEKAKGLEKSPFGIVGLETSFALLYTYLVKKGIITLEKLISLMHTNPAKRFGISAGIKTGGRADITVFDLDEEYIIDPDDFLSKGKSTPFEGFSVFGRCIMTMKEGKIVWQADQTGK